jgi:iron(III) transport system substrate-binding protein
MSALVVYCAHDAVFAESILRDFEKQSGIPVVVRYDSEATKSLGFVNLLIQEKDNPQCDVFWNNELLGTCELQEQQVLAPYAGPGFQRIPDSFKDPQGFWAGFAARLRVYIVNTDRCPADEAAIESRLAGKDDLARVTIALAAAFAPPGVIRAKFGRLPDRAARTNVELGTLFAF